MVRVTSKEVKVFLLGTLLTNPGKFSFGGRMQDSSWMNGLDPEMAVPVSLQERIISLRARGS